MQKIFFVCAHTQTFSLSLSLCAFPFFHRASFQWANAFGNEPKQEPRTDSWVLTPHPVRAEQCCCHRKQRALMSEVKLGAHAAKVKLKELQYLSTGVLKQVKTSFHHQEHSLPMSHLYSLNKTTPLLCPCNCVGK